MLFFTLAALNFFSICGSAWRPAYCEYLVAPSNKKSISSGAVALVVVVVAAVLCPHKFQSTAAQKE